MHGCGADIFTGIIKFAGPVASFNKTTQRRQFAVSTGSGGTEVKPQVFEKNKENLHKVNTNVKLNF
jgi:hypothetical protein